MSETCAGFYDRIVVPRVTHGACSLNVVTALRRRVVPAAQGIVVEVGIGSGLNLPHYDKSKVKKVIGVDPGTDFVKLAHNRAKAAPFALEILNESAEAMSLEDNLADTVVVTYALCSIPDAGAALREIRRILKPGGRLLFCEHGRSHRTRTAKWQDRINPLWKSMSGGCNLNRNIFRLVQNSGFEVDFVDTFKPAFMPGLFGFHYVGSARAG